MGSQEEKDLQFAMALQKEENAVAFASTKKRVEETMKAQQNRTARSSVGTSLGHIRKIQNNAVTRGTGYGDYSAPGSEDIPSTPDLDYVGTAKMVEDMVKTDAALNDAAKTRNARSGVKPFKKH